MPQKHDLHPIKMAGNFVDWSPATRVPEIGRKYPFQFSITCHTAPRKLFSSYDEFTEDTNALLLREPPYQYSQLNVAHKMDSDRACVDCYKIAQMALILKPTCNLDPPSRLHTNHYWHHMLAQAQI